MVGVKKDVQFRTRNQAGPVGTVNFAASDELRAGLLEAKAYGEMADVGQQIASYAGRSMLEQGRVEAQIAGSTFGGQRDAQGNPVKITEIPADLGTVYGRNFYSAAAETYVANVRADAKQNATRIAMESPANSAQFTQKFAEYQRATLENVDERLAPVITAELDAIGSHGAVSVLAEEMKVQRQVRMQALTEDTQSRWGDISGALHINPDLDQPVVKQSIAGIEANLNAALKAGDINEAEYNAAIAEMPKQLFVAQQRGVVDGIILGESGTDRFDKARAVARDMVNSTSDLMPNIDDRRALYGELSSQIAEEERRIQSGERRVKAERAASQGDFYDSSIARWARGERFTLSEIDKWREEGRISSGQWVSLSQLAGAERTSQLNAVQKTTDENALARFDAGLITLDDVMNDPEVSEQAKGIAMRANMKVESARDDWVRDQDYRMWAGRQTHLSEQQLQEEYLAWRDSTNSSLTWETVRSSWASGMADAANVNLAQTGYNKLGRMGLNDKEWKAVESNFGVVDSSPQSIAAATALMLRGDMPPTLKSWINTSSKTPEGRAEVLAWWDQVRGGPNGPMVRSLVTEKTNVTAEQLDEWAQDYAGVPDDPNKAFTAGNVRDDKMGLSRQRAEFVHNGVKSTDKEFNPVEVVRDAFAQGTGWYDQLQEWGKGEWISPHIESVARDLDRNNVDINEALLSMPAGMQQDLARHMDSIIRMGEIHDQDPHKVAALAMQRTMKTWGHDLVPSNLARRDRIPSTFALMQTDDVWSLAWTKNPIDLGSNNVPGPTYTGRDATLNAYAWLMFNQPEGIEGHDWHGLQIGLESIGNGQANIYYVDKAGQQVFLADDTTGQRVQIPTRREDSFFKALWEADFLEKDQAVSEAEYSKWFAERIARGELSLIMETHRQTLLDSMAGATAKNRQQRIKALRE